MVLLCKFELNRLLHSCKRHELGRVIWLFGSCSNSFSNIIIYWITFSIISKLLTLPSFGMVGTSCWSFFRTWVSSGFSWIIFDLLVICLLKFTSKKHFSNWICLFEFKNFKWWKSNFLIHKQQKSFDKMEANKLETSHHELDATKSNFCICSIETLIPHNFFSNVHDVLQIFFYFSSSVNWIQQLI